MSDKRIVCRCEDVSAHDIEEAVGKGYRDLESVKRFTGLATGWCQGKHCLSTCVRELVRCGGQVPQAPITPRPPIHPLSLAQLAGLGEKP